MNLLLTTKNSHKIEEIKQVLKDKAITLITLSDLNDEETIEETGKTFQENALLKAKYYGDKHNLLSLSDDSGLEVFSLNNQPGVHSHRYGKTHEEANQRLMKAIEGKDPKARFTTVLCLYNPKTNEHHFYEGHLYGKIINTPRGHHGFGYDPIFLLDSNQTLAELTLKEKTAISHRSIALNKLRGDL